MKTRTQIGVGRDAIRTCYKLTDEIYCICEAIRYANKPTDLYFPTSELIKMVRRLQVFQDQWMNKWLDAHSERLEQWPKLWERFH